MAVNQLVLSVDNRIVSVSSISKSAFRDHGLDWMRKGENKDYWSNDFVRVTQSELRAYQEAAKNLQRLAIKAVKHVAQRNLWSDLDVPDFCIPLLEYSIAKETDLHLIGRFDFAGGIDRLPIKMLEYNADTCSLIPETAILQTVHAREAAKSLNNAEPYNDIARSLAAQFQEVMAKRGGDDANLLLSTLGYDEDRLNCDLVALGAKKAGIQDTQSIALEGILFSPDEGIFVSDGRDEYRRYDFFYKHIPWEFIAFEEPDLWKLLDPIIRNELATVLNPAFSMLLQNKALMQIMYELEPNNPYLLKTTNSAKDFPSGYYVRKPQYGRMGENISYYESSTRPVYETDGDYGDYDPVFQALAKFNIDKEDHRYQPSIFYTGEPSALCFRRQDDLIIDDDAEFVGSVIDG